MAYPSVAEPLRDVAADNLQGTRDGHKLGGFTVNGYAEVGIHQFAFQVDCLELLIMPLQPLYLGTVEPIAEALPTACESPFVPVPRYTSASPAR